jgi:hypothetical protein
MSWLSITNIVARRIETEDKIKRALRERRVRKVLRLEEEFEKFDFGCMTDQTLASSYKEDVESLTGHPWIRPETSVRVFPYDIKAGLVHDVEAGNYD